ncbi:MAG: NnrU family protein [Proteobacteria bacterium]|nr:NnrU family protein [Pseudomonadota bacterium]
MSMLVAAAAVFFGIHLFIAGTRLRDGITGAIGERAYQGLFSLASLGVIAWLCVAYNTAQASGGNRVLYDLGVGVRHLAIPVIALAFFLGVQGLFTPSPTLVGAEATASKEGTIKGVLRITRHPFLWGVVIWSAFHLAANGDEASVIFFGTFLLLAFFGTFSIDAKKKRKMGEAWNAFAAKTSNIPFAAVLARRNALKIGESFGWRFVVAMLIFAGMLYAHAWIFKASPFPNGYVPPL